MEWLLDNYLSLFGIALATLALAKAVAKVTPTKTDDQIVSQVEAVVSRILGEADKKE